MISYDELVSYLRYENGKFYWKKKTSIQTIIGTRAGHLNSQGYIIIGFNNKKYYEHRLVWFYHYKEWPLYIIDHINKNPSDNRLENLRLCLNGNKDNKQNINVPKNNTSGVVGVIWDKSRHKWKSRIGINGKIINLGSFDNKEEAIIKRKEAELKYHLFVNT